MKKILITLCLILSLSPLFSQKDKRLKGLEKDLNEILEVTKAPGFAVAIVEGQKMGHIKNLGIGE